MMGQDERRDDADRREDASDFEPVTREVREGQSHSVGEEGTEEDRKQWRKTRDLHKETEQITEKADERHR